MRGDRENRNDNRENKDRGVNRGPRSSMPRGEHRDQGAPSTNSNLTSNSNVTTRSSSSEFVSPTQSGNFRNKFDDLFFLFLFLFFIFFITVQIIHILMINQI